MTMKARRPQLGKLRGWSAGLGSKFGGGNSSNTSSNNTDSSVKQDLSSEIEQRGLGNSNLYSATEAYWSYLCKKKSIPFDASTLQIEDTSSVGSNSMSTKPEGRVLPIEAVGLAMASFGSAYSEGSAYGSCLNLLGEAHIKLGSLQAAFAKDTSNIFLSHIARSKATIEAFNGALKKLNSATVRLEAAQVKVQKSKKEKRELEEEFRLAKAAYDEAVSDVEARADVINESEYDDWECLTTYMQTHLDYIGQAQALLEQVKTSWIEPSASRPPVSSVPMRSRSASGSKPQAPILPRRASAKDPIELSRIVSRMTNRSSISLTQSDTGRVKDSDSATTSINGDAKKLEKEKKSRLRMPSLSGAADSVSFMAAGIGSLAKSSSSRFSPSHEGGSRGSLDKERNDTINGSNGGSGVGTLSRWNLLSRNKKDQQGFQNMQDDERLGLPIVHNKVGSDDVALGPHDSDVNLFNDQVINSHHVSPRFTHGESERIQGGEEEDSDTSPFSPSDQTIFPPTIHERGESGLSMHLPIDSNYLGPSTVIPTSLSINHTGLSVYSDGGGDPFLGYTTSGPMLSPQATGGGGGEPDSDYDEQTTALTAGLELDRISKPSTNSYSNGSSWKFSSKRPPPPPPPSLPPHSSSSSSSSASFLSKAKANKLAPPPLPARNNI